VTDGGVEVVVVGPGAMGCLHAALLTEGGLSVGLLDHRPERAATIHGGGITVERDGQQVVVSVRCSADASEFFPAKLAIILVKAYDTETAVKGLLAALDDDASVLTLQNGLGNYERIARHVAAERVLAGTTSSGATLLGVGRVREAGRGGIRLGSPFGQHERARQVADTLSRGGLECEANERVEDILWEKAVINAAINPLTALKGVPNGELLEDEDLREHLRAITEEAAGVARAVGVQLPADMVAVVEEVCRRTAANRSSMLQDLSGGRRTEIDYICGEIVRRAEEQGMGAPLCSALTALIGAAEKQGDDAS
jgi:2-dehydropantoate 2-reductase